MNYTADSLRQPTCEMFKFMAVQLEKDRTGIACFEGLPKKTFFSLKGYAARLRFAKLHLNKAGTVSFGQKWTIVHS